MIQSKAQTHSKISNDALPLLNNEKLNPKRQEQTADQIQKEPPVEQIMKNILFTLKDKDSIIKDLFTLEKTQDKQLLEPFSYIFKNGGKRIRLVIAILINGLFNSDISDEVIQMGGFIEILHTGSLIIDDIEDQSLSRRNMPCAHLVHGVDKSINSANLMYFLPFKKIISGGYTEIQKAKMMEIYARQMITCHLGQAQDIRTHKITKAEDLPPLYEYIRLTSAKTSGLFTMLIEMLSIALKIDNETTQVLINVMRYVDDMLNVTQNMGKGISAEDFHQRKFTILIHFLRGNQQFMDLFFKPQKSSQNISRMLQIVMQSNALESCRQIAYGYAEKALKQIQKIKCTNSKASFKAMIRYIVERKK